MVLACMAGHQAALPTLFSWSVMDNREHGNLRWGNGAIVWNAPGTRYFYLSAVLGDQLHYLELRFLFNQRVGYDFHWCRGFHKADSSALVSSYFQNAVAKYTDAFA